MLPIIPQPLRSKMDEKEFYDLGKAPRMPWWRRLMAARRARGKVQREAAGKAIAAASRATFPTSH